MSSHNPTVGGRSQDQPQVQAKLGQEGMQMPPYQSVLSKTFLYKITSTFEFESYKHSILYIFPETWTVNEWR